MTVTKRAPKGATLAELSNLSTTTAPRTEASYQVSLANALNAARIADQLRAQNIVVLDLTRITSIVDFFVIVTGTSTRQMHAIADEVNHKLKHEDGNRRISIEGYRTEGNWILTDYGDVVLHVFTPDGRQLYNLEQLWADAPRIDWQNAK
jgi:ribosome-associated protein